MKVSSIKIQVSRLEDLVLLSQGGTSGLLCQAYLCWAHTSVDRLFRITVAPFVFQGPSRDLIHLHLHDFETRYLSPKALANALSGMDHLRSLDLSHARR